MVSGMRVEFPAIADYIMFIRPLAVRLASILGSGLAIMSEADPLGLFF